jgi:hypothetical protein
VSAYARILELLPGAGGLIVPLISLRIEPGPPIAVHPDRTVIPAVAECANA